MYIITQATFKIDSRIVKTEFDKTICVLRTLEDLFAQLLEKEILYSFTFFLADNRSPNRPF